MSTIVTRSGKGSPLSHVEVDTNFTNLNTDKIQSGNTVAALTITSATINGGAITGITDLAITDGGTGASDAATARTNLGVAIGTNVQAYDADLAAIAALSPTADNFIVGNGTAWILETPAQARTSLGATTVGSNLLTLPNPSAIAFPRLNADNTVSSLDASTFRTAIGAGTSSTNGTVTSVGITGGTAISVSGSPVTGSGSITVNNTGVTSIVAGTGISISGGTGAVTVTASGGGVTSAVAGNGVAVSAATGAVTFSAACPTFNTVGSYCQGAIDNQGYSVTAGTNYAAGTGSSPPLGAQSICFQLGNSWDFGPWNMQVTNNLSGTWKWMAGPGTNNGAINRSAGLMCRVS